MAFDRTAAAAESAAPYLAIADIGKRFRQTTVLQALDLAVARGEFVSLLGPSGCGKTTLLRIVAGLLSPDSGTVRLAGRDLTRLPAHRRNVSVVFQNYALFPHLSVFDNVAFGLRSQRRARAEIAQLVDRALARVQLQDFADRAIAVLSGGQSQRVAVARALAVEPDLLLLDEPFSALDRKLRETMQIELKHVLRDLGITAIFVTHDQDEALIMSDRIAVMNRGRIEQLAPPADIYARPATPFVLDFVGLSTRLPGRVTAQRPGQVRLQTAQGEVWAPGQAEIGSEMLIAVRPEKISLDTAGAAAAAGNRLDLTVADIVFLGSKTQVHFHADAAGRALAELAQLPAGGLLPGQTVAVHWRIEDTLLYPGISP